MGSNFQHMPDPYEAGRGFNDPPVTLKNVQTAMDIVTQADADELNDRVIAEALRTHADEHERASERARIYAQPYREWLDRHADEVDA